MIITQWILASDMVLSKKKMGCYKSTKQGEMLNQIIKLKYLGAVIKWDERCLIEIYKGRTDQAKAAISEDEQYFICHFYWMSEKEFWNVM